MSFCLSHLSVSAGQQQPFKELLRHPSKQLSRESPDGYLLLQARPSIIRPLRVTSRIDLRLALLHRDLSRPHYPYALSFPPSCWPFSLCTLYFFSFFFFTLVYSKCLHLSPEKIVNFSFFFLLYRGLHNDLYPSTHRLARSYCTEYVPVAGGSMYIVTLSQYAVVAVVAVCK